MSFRDQLRNNNMNRVKDNTIPFFRNDVNVIHNNVLLGTPKCKFGVN